MLLLEREGGQIKTERKFQVIWSLWWMDIKPPKV